MRAQSRDDNISLHALGLEQAQLAQPARHVVCSTDCPACRQFGVGLSDSMQLSLSVCLSLSLPLSFSFTLVYFWLNAKTRLKSDTLDVSHHL